MSKKARFNHSSVYTQALTKSRAFSKTAILNEKRFERHSVVRGVAMAG